MCEVFYDSLTEAMWFLSLDDRLRGATLSLIGRRGTNPPVIDEIVSYDKPDIILLVNGVPVLVIEKTSEVPTGHNVGQRFARLVKSVEMGITTFAFFPFDAMKHGEYAGICNLNIRFLAASFRMFDIHNTYLLAVNWPCDDYGELVIDGPENNQISYLVSHFIDSNFDKHNSSFVEHYNDLLREYTQRLRVYPRYGRFPNSVSRDRTYNILRYYNVQNPPADFASREHSYVYTIGMSPRAAKRQDPYTGTQFIYDYIGCRTGPRPRDKNVNLVLRFPNITIDEWFHMNPNDPNTKSCNWYLTANALMFSDAIFFNRV